jgi:Uma2 family endonuclease
MATATVPEQIATEKATPVATLTRAIDSRVLLRDVSWDLFAAIDATQRDGSDPRLAYDRGALELMSPSYEHEILKDRFHDFVKIVARGLRLDHQGAGSTRWERANIARAREPDACFSIANDHRVRGLKQIDLPKLPPPDLAIEIVLTNPLVDALAIDAALGIPEVWTYDGRSLRFLYLDAGGHYAEHESSRSFPTLRSWEAHGWILQADAIGDLEWADRLECWVRDELARRQPGTA